MLTNLIEDACVLAGEEMERGGLSDLISAG